MDMDGTGLKWMDMDGCGVEFKFKFILTVIVWGSFINVDEIIYF